MLIVFGAITMTLLFRTGRLPQPGDTVLCDAYAVISSGKGANQALAATRIGAKTALVGCAGDDGPALRMLRSLRHNGVMTTGVAESPDLPTGCTIAMVDSDGNAQTVTAAGANAKTQADQIPDEILTPSTVLLLQAELSPEENRLLIDRASARGTTIIMNLSPPVPIPQDTLEKLDYLIVNEAEARAIAKRLGLTAGRGTPELAAALSRQGKLNCIVTRAEQGSVACRKNGDFVTVPALKLEQVVDPTGAGDAYCGTFAAAIYAGRDMSEAMRMAAVAGSLACTKEGAQESFPYLGDIEASLGRLGTTEERH